MRSVLVLAAALVAFASSVHAEAPPRSLAELRSRVQAILDERAVPGAGLAIVDARGVRWAGGVGLADVATRRPVDADTHFRAGSITKTVVALAVMRLVEQGRLRLDARLADVAPELAADNPWRDTRPVTLAHLLEHTAGFDDMRPNEMYAPVEAEAWPLARVLALNPRSRTSRWAPGERASYSNPGYTVAAYLLEKAGGRPWRALLEGEVLRPLGMSTAALALDPVEERRLATGYAGDPSTATPIPYRAIYHGPAGDLMASPREVAQLARLFIARGTLDGNRYLDARSIARMERAETIARALPDVDFGLGTYGDPFTRVPTRGHDGGIDGYVASFRYAPSRGVGWVVMLNKADGDALARISRLLCDYTVADAETPPPVAAPSEEELAAWVGHYDFDSPRHQLLAWFAPLTGGVDVLLRDGKLWLRAVAASEEQLPLEPAGGDRFRVPNVRAPLVAFHHRADGTRAFRLGPMATFGETPALRARVRYQTTRVVLALLFTTLLIAPIWMLRRGIARLRGRPRLRAYWLLRGLPLVAAGCLFAIPVLFVAAAIDHSLGVECGLTIALWLVSWGFAVTSSLAMVVGVWSVTRPDSPLPWGARLHSLLVANAAYLAVVYLMSYGIIGLRTWLW